MESYIILIYAKTRLEQLIARYNTRAQARFYLEQKGIDFSIYEQEHERYYAGLSQLEQRLASHYKYKLLEREFVARFLYAPGQIIVVFGQDGLVANTAKYALQNPIVAINPDPAHYDGVLLPFQLHSFERGLKQVIQGAYKHRTIRFAEARLNDGQRLMAFNELFVGAASHVSARYQLSYRRQQEEQSSSGILVATQAGSTAWLSSMFNMVNGLCATFGSGYELRQPQVADDQLVFAVREPFQSLQSQCKMVAGKLSTHDHLRLTSRMPSGGVIFSDGIERDFMHFNAGAIATIGLAKETAALVLP